MQKENYRRIEYKLKNLMYIRLTEDVIEELVEKVIGQIYKQASKNQGGYHVFNKEQLEDVFDYLQRLYPKFFCQQEPKKKYLSQKSFFEYELDAGILIWRLTCYIDSKEVDPDNIDDVLEERYYAAKGKYIKKK